MATIRRELQEKADREAYARMVRPTSRTQPRLMLGSANKQPQYLTTGKEQLLAEEEWRQTRSEVTALLNVLLTMIAVAFAAWWILGHQTPGKVGTGLHLESRPF